MTQVLRSGQIQSRTDLSSDMKPIEPFYFKSYDKVIGVARNLQELDKEMKRLARENTSALEYHLASGHIARWLEYANERELACQLGGITKVQEAVRITDRYVERAATLRRMARGRMH